MSGVAIVAVPNKSNPVWAVSSEKIPHMTLLYLGDALAEEDYRKVQEFVTHVADTTLHRFGMSVDKRGTLGDDDADVLFFQNRDDSKISLFRAYLLQDTTIREAYESVEQFEGWTPHLTLGYPDSPAKKDPREISEFYWVGFDKLMIWTDEFAGPEIELNEEDLAVAMSGVDEATEAFLAHYGVKGMRWGVRKSALTTGTYGSTHGPVRAGVRLGGDKRPSGIDKASAAYNNTLLGKVTTSLTRVLASGPYAAASVGYVLALAATGPAGIPIATGAAAVGQVLGTHSLVAAWSNKDNVRRINNNPKYKGKDLKANPKLRKEYHKEQLDSFGRAMLDPRGLRLAETKARVSGKAGDPSIVVRPKDLLHADDVDVSVTIDLVYNETGHIVEFVPQVPKELADAFYDIMAKEDGLAQSDLDKGAEFLAHYGVKGMQWGVRKSVSSQERSARRSEKKTAKNEKAAAKLVKIQTKAAKEAAMVNRANAKKSAKQTTPGRPGSKKEWVQKSMTQAKAKEVMQAATPRITKDLTALVKTMPDRPLKGKERRAYDRQALDIINQHLDTASRSVVGVSPNGRKTATASMTPNGTLVMRVTRTKTAERRGNTLLRGAAAGYLVTHADDDVVIEEFQFKVLRNKNGFIEGFEIIDAELGLAQSDLDNGTSFLEHYGVKGMQWGVRRSREERRADRTAKVQAAAEKKVAKAEQYTARANAKAEVAKARTATADAKAAAANARLETKLAEKQAKFAKAEARSGKDDPANGLIRDTSGVVGSSNRESMKLRDAAAKDVRTLDDKTLADYTKRVDTEKKLKQAIKEDQAPAKTATKKLIADAGKDVAKTALVGAGSMAVFYLLGRVGASRGQNPKPKINWEGAANTTTNSKSKAKDAFDFAKEAADAARTTSVPKNKYPGAIPTTGRALP